MQQNPHDNSTMVTSGGTFCLFDSSGRLIGTILRPVDRHPLGAGRETVYLARPLVAEHAADHAA